MFESYSICDDPSKWNLSDPKFIDFIIQNLKQQDPKNLDFSKSKKFFNDKNRFCSQNLFFKRHVNGELIPRYWMFYSESLGKIFCIYCTLFSNKRFRMFTDIGFDDWKHPNLISTHETSTSHCEAARIFVKRSSEINNLTSTINKQILVETCYWKEILRRVVSVIRFLASRGMPFLGSNQQIGNSSNGNYLGLLELIAEYDVLLQSHIEKYAGKGRGSVSYLSYNTANEFIHFLADEVRAVIKREIYGSKYFSLIVDSTPDISHTDQLTIVIRYVNEAGLSIERFFEFLPNTGHKGKDMESEVVEFLKNREIDIMNCRGQAYDNASNMSGKYNGLQSRIKAINELAVYIPCSGHTLNLTATHAAEVSNIVARFFLFIQNVYVFFSASTYRWQILIQQLKADLHKRNVKNERVLVPKRLSDTRWCARAASCRALKAGYGSFVSALNKISTDTDEKMVS